MPTTKKARVSTFRSPTSFFFILICIGMITLSICSLIEYYQPKLSGFAFVAIIYAFIAICIITNARRKGDKKET